LNPSNKEEQVKRLTDCNPHDKAAVRLGRRRLLRALAATGGAAAAATLLPGEWVKPVIEIGHLPAHAQSSAPFITNDIQTTITGQRCTNGSTPPQPGNLYRISFNYDNASGDVRPGSVVHHAFEFRPLAITGSFDVPLTATHITGDGFTGEISYNVCIAFADAIELVNIISLTDVSGRTSIPSTSIMPKPANALDTDSASIGCTSD